MVWRCSDDTPMNVAANELQMDDVNTVALKIDSKGAHPRFVQSWSMSDYGLSQNDGLRPHPNTNSLRVHG